MKRSGRAPQLGLGCCERVALSVGLAAHTVPVTVMSRPMSLVYSALSSVHIAAGPEALLRGDEARGQQGEDAAEQCGQVLREGAHSLRLACCGWPEGISRWAASQQVQEPLSCRHEKGSVRVRGRRRVHSPVDWLTRRQG